MIYKAPCLQKGSMFWWFSSRYLHLPGKSTLTNHSWIVRTIKLVIKYKQVKYRVGERFDVFFHSFVESRTSFGQIRKKSVVPKQNYSVTIGHWNLTYAPHSLPRVRVLHISTFIFSLKRSGEKSYAASHLIEKSKDNGICKALYENLPQ